MLAGGGACIGFFDHVRNLINPTQDAPPSPWIPRSWAVYNSLSSKGPPHVGLRVLLPHTMLQRIHRRYRRRFSSQGRDRPAVRAEDDTTLLQSDTLPSVSAPVPFQASIPLLTGDSGYPPEPVGPPPPPANTSFLFPPMDAYVSSVGYYLPTSMPVPHLEMSEEAVTVGSVSDSFSVSSLASVAAHVHEGPPQFTRAERALDRRGAFNIVIYLLFIFLWLWSFRACRFFVSGSISLLCVVVPAGDALDGAMSDSTAAATPMTEVVEALKSSISSFMHDIHWLMRILDDVAKIHPFVAGVYSFVVF